MQTNSTSTHQITQWQEVYNSVYAKWVGLNLTPSLAHKRALKAAKKYHPAHIAAQARRLGAANARNAAHRQMDKTTWAMLNGVKL